MQKNRKKKYVLIPVKEINSVNLNTKYKNVWNNFQLAYMNKNPRDAKSGKVIACKGYFYN